MRFNVNPMIMLFKMLNVHVRFRSHLGSMAFALISSPLFSRIPASSGNAAEGLAPPRGGDRNILKPFVIPQPRTGPLASSQPPHRAPIDTEVRQPTLRKPEWKRDIWEKQPVALEHGEESNEELTEKKKRKKKSPQLSCHFPRSP